MAETHNLVEEPTEEQQLDEISTVITQITKLQPKLLTETDKSEISQTQGRKCVLSITLKNGDVYRKYFEVTDRGVSIVEPYETGNAYITAPVASVLRVLKGVLAGDPTSFSSEWARGQATIRGPRHLHDGMVFAGVFSRLALSIQRFTKNPSRP